MPKRHLEGATQADRAKIRKQLGTLRSLTVQPLTRARYQKAREEFYEWLRQERLVLPASSFQLDLVVSDYLEHLWATGQGRSAGSNILAGLQDTQPHLKGKLKLSWRLMKTWVTNEIPNRAPPLPLEGLYAMVGYSLFHQEFDFALSLLVAFFGLLRTGELLALKSRHIMLRDAKGPAVISLGLTKSGKRHGAAEHVTIHTEEVCRRLFAWKKTAKADSSLAGPAHKWRQRFAEIVDKVGFSAFDFRPYSLRRGGATYFFQSHGSFDRLLTMGRWNAVSTARIYVNDGLAVLAEMKLPWNPFNRNLRSQYVKSLTQPLSVSHTKSPSHPRGRWNQRARKSESTGSAH